ncbi:FMN-linked oxidoreductase [Dacryopinax primogenitus]|uniref:FMN-linked oxidoreductase n=1 Tax=Dacryopinax primogenitus (strain DJM 731) TaxID=1858805 RepID=M5GDL5_DACPD|nr:FMN-linked oxidoreductase [Dacryopinax primogenitus]EJU02513.1 FMN-linked oxidoreductase [Dacryopinax primogenitus]
MRHTPPTRSPTPDAKRTCTEIPSDKAGPSTSSWTRHPVHYGKGIHLAPMVRSGTMPTRLLALEAGAELVWTPETVDRAIIGCERRVDPKTGVITYIKSHKPVLTLHPVERPRLIFQLGSANPDLAAEAAKIIYQDVAGIDLNCGCPKHFSVHAGMGAGLLLDPDKLCAILQAIRASIPPEVPVSCKIRMLPSQEDTLSLVRQIADTGTINCLTVHCRTPPMRDREPAMKHRLKDIVQSVGKKVVVVENGDCVGYESAQQILQQTTARAVMIARAAEANPTCFLPDGPKDAETYLIPRYVRLAKYLDHHWSNTKFCLAQFTSPDPHLGKHGRLEWKKAINGAKSYEELRLLWGKEAGFFEGGEEILAGIQHALRARGRSAPELGVLSTPGPALSQQSASSVIDPAPPDPILVREIQAVV